MPEGIQTPQVQTGKFDASGNCTIRFQNNSVHVWRVVGGSVGPTVPVVNSCRCTLMKMAMQTLDSTPFAGYGAAATGDTDLMPSEFIDAVFSGGPANGTAQTTFYYEELS